MTDELRQSNPENPDAASTPDAAPPADDAVMQENLRAAQTGTVDQADPPEVRTASPGEPDPAAAATTATTSSATAAAAPAAAPAAATAEAAAATFPLEDFSDPGKPLAAGALELLDDVELDVKIELGRTEMYIEDVLKLGVGSVVELDKLAGDPVDIFVNERLIARGEVLVLNDNFCVRINDIVSAFSETSEK